jgi:hypothetical protein
MIEPLFIHIQKLVNMPVENDDGSRTFDSAYIKQLIMADMLGHISQSDIEAMAADQTSHSKVKLQLYQKLVLIMPKIIHEIRIIILK